MAHSVTVYKNGIELGSGSATHGSTSITGYTATLDRICERRNCQITITDGDHAGATWFSRVLDDDGAGNLTIAEPCPFQE